MSQVSKRLLSQKVQDRIFTLFVTSIIMCDHKDITVSLIKDLFTPTERMMLSKRFSIAYMLLKEYDYDSIEQILKVSRGTIGHTALWLKERGEGYRKIINKIKKSESMRSVLNEIQDAFQELIADMPGQNWSQSKKILWKSRQERKAPF